MYEVTIHAKSIDQPDATLRILKPDALEAVREAFIATMSGMGSRVDRVGSGPIFEIEVEWRHDLKAPYRAVVYFPCRSAVRAGAS